MEIGIHLIQTAAQRGLRSVPTWSLRLQPVCSFFPTGPSRESTDVQPQSERPHRQSRIELPLGRLTADGLQLLQLIRFGMGDDAAGGQHAGMGDGAVQILLKQGGSKPIEALNVR